MSDHLDRAAEVLARVGCQPDDEPSFLDREYARALDAAGLLASPEHDAERAVGSPAVAEPPVSREDVEAVLKLAYKGTSDMDREPNWLGRVRRWARDGAPFPTVESTPEPATPEHDAAVAEVVRLRAEIGELLEDKSQHFHVTREIPGATVTEYNDPLVRTSRLRALLNPTEGEGRGR